MQTVNLHTADGVIVTAPGIGILDAYGTTVPTDAAAGYATGCIFRHTDGTGGTALYINEGSLTSCNFDAVSALTATQEGLLGAVAGTATASKALIVDANIDLAALRNLTLTGSVKSSLNAGTANTGVTAAEYGDGYNHCTVLTVAQTNAFTVADNSALCDGSKLYTFPAGEIVVESASISLGVTLAEDTTATPEIGLGTVEGSDTQATLGADDAGCENILGPATSDDCAGTAEVLTSAVGAGTPLVLAAADGHIVYCNIAATWADTAGSDLTGDLAGTVVLFWKFVA